MLTKQIMQSPWKKAALAALAAMLLIAAFWFIPFNLGDDWMLYQGSIWHALQGQPIYSNAVNQVFYFYNPPWVLAPLLPLGLLPAKLGWSILSIFTLLCLLLLARHFKLSPIKLSLLVLSPPVIYTILHGQIDVLVLAAFLLPSEWRPIVALTKPQVGLGLLFGTELANWKRTLLVTGAVLALSFLVFGLWPMQLIHQPMPFIASAHNYLSGTWPLLIPAGLGLVFMGLQRKDVRYFMAASPLFSPYAAISSLVGVWFAACSALNTWQAAIVLVSWWGVILFHGSI
jgi:hypothetical protein